MIFLKGAELVAFSSAPNGWFYDFFSFINKCCNLVVGFTIKTVMMAGFVCCVNIKKKSILSFLPDFYVKEHFFITPLLFSVIKLQHKLNLTLI